MFFFLLQLFAFFIVLIAMIHPEHLSLGAAGLKAAKVYKKKKAFDFLGENGLYNTISYEQFGIKIQQLASLLKQMGIRPGDRVMLLSENRPEWPLAYFGTALSGAVVVPILTDFIAEHIGTIAAHAEVSAVFTTEKHLSKIAEAGIQKDIPIIRIDTMKKELDKDYISISIQGCEKSFPLHNNNDFPEVHEDTVASIIYTSGTTGSSKGVMLSHKNILSNAAASRCVVKIYPRDRMLSVIPLAHTYESTVGMVIGVLSGAGTSYLDRVPAPAVLVQAVQLIRPTIMLTVPLIIEKIYRHRIKPVLESNLLYKFPLTKLLAIKIAGRKLLGSLGGAIRFFGIGGAALSPDVEEFLHKAEFPYAIGYGLTETAPLLAGSKPFQGKLRSTGFIMDGVSVRTVDESGNIVGGFGCPQKSPPNREGEIQAKGPNVMRGYYKDEEKTSEVFTEDGWFKTGDLGSFDKKGRLSIKGRSKAMILGPSGENIYPEEIEGILNAYEIVEDSLVYSDESGRLTALIVLSEKAQTMLAAFGDNLSELKKMANKRLSAFSHITRIEIQAEPFEKTATKKIKRFLYPKKEIAES
jgi:long-chain acyl-CoA synthetase